jgi:hypothetical protein
VLISTTASDKSLPSSRASLIHQSLDHFVPRERQSCFTAEKSLVHLVIGENPEGYHCPSYSRDHQPANLSQFYFAAVIHSTWPIKLFFLRSITFLTESPNRTANCPKSRRPPPPPLDPSLSYSAPTTPTSPLSCASYSSRPPQLHKQPNMKLATSHFTTPLPLLSPNGHNQYEDILTPTTTPPSSLPSLAPILCQHGRNSESCTNCGGTSFDADATKTWCRGCGKIQ